MAGITTDLKIITMRLLRRCPAYSEDHYYSTQDLSTTDHFNFSY